MPPDWEKRIDPESLAILRAQLQLSLAKVDNVEIVQTEQLKPRTLAEVELLEQKLTAALDELRVRKAELETEHKHHKPSAE
jgi:hypothetical protein